MSGSHACPAVGAPALRVLVLCDDFSAVTVRFDPMLNESKQCASPESGGAGVGGYFGGGCPMGLGLSWVPLGGMKPALSRAKRAPPQYFGVYRRAASLAGYTIRMTSRGEVRAFFGCALGGHPRVACGRAAAVASYRCKSYKVGVDEGAGVWPEIHPPLDGDGLAMMTLYIGPYLSRTLGPIWGAVASAQPIAPPWFSSFTSAHSRHATPGCASGHRGAGRRDVEGGRCRWRVPRSAGLPHRSVQDDSLRELVELDGCLVQGEREPVHMLLMGTGEVDDLDLERLQP
ncbi:hypothetical protein Esti_003095 [Eimeria stiedai]